MYLIHCVGLRREKSRFGEGILSSFSILSILSIQVAARVFAGAQKTNFQRPRKPARCARAKAKNSLPHTTVLARAEKKSQINRGGEKTKVIKLFLRQDAVLFASPGGHEGCRASGTRGVDWDLVPSPGGLGRVLRPRLTRVPRPTFCWLGGGFPAL